MTGGESDDGVIVTIFMNSMIGILGVIRGLAWSAPWDARVVSIQVQ